MIFRALPWPLTLRSLIGCAAVLACTSYAACSLQNGWIPHDEGQLGHTAERILAGELPHRDFIEPYTGGLGYLNALAFRVLGIRSEVLRWQMIPFFAAFAGCIYFITSRVWPPAVAAAITFLAASLSVPIYPAGMPSWYNLFAATYGTAALLRYVDTNKSRWLLAAGLCGGLSILVKITGLYFVAAAMLWIVYKDQLSCNPNDRRSPIFSSSASLVLGAVGSLGLLFVRPENPLVDGIHFSIPFALLAAFLIRNEWRFGRGEFAMRSARLAKRLAAFSIGLAVPLLAFVTLFIEANATSDLIQGLFVLPARRLAGARMALPDFQWLMFALPLAALYVLGLRNRPFLSKPAAVCVGALLLMLAAVSHTETGHFAIFQGIRHQIPVLVVVGLGMLWKNNVPVSNLRRRQELFLLATVGFFVSLIQFPYSGGFYFFYAAPLAVVLTSYIVAWQPYAPQRLHGAIGALLIAFLLLRMHDPNPAITGGPYAPQTQTMPLKLDRCQLVVRRDQATLYNRLINSIQQHSGTQDYIYAAPDCPEIYFLSGRKNPTRSLYNFFEQQDPEERARLLTDLDRLRVNVVVLKQFSEFTPQLDSEFVNALEKRFPNRQTWMAEDGSSRPAFVLLWRS